MDNFSFDEIRPFSDSELPDAFKSLIKEESIKKIVEKLYPNIPFSVFSKQLAQTKSSIEFQKKFIVPILQKLEDEKSCGITYSGFEQLDKNKPCLFISNHRDIILDSAFLNFILLKNNSNTTEIAIGDNLLIAPWIRTLVRINRSFIIQRNAPLHQMIQILSRQSAYIRQTIVERNQSIWLAQREGRAKNSDDRTQDSLLKMLLISGKKSFVENIQELNICPVSISYEYDPCDYLKAKEFQQKRDSETFKKTPQDDLLNMMEGLNGFKGHIHYHFCPNLNNKITSLSGSKNELIAQIAQLIDKEIHANYRIYTCNKIAYDLLKGQQKYSHQYTTDEKSAFEQRLRKQIEKIDLPHVDTEFVQHKLLEMYANVLINKEKATN